MSDLAAALAALKANRPPKWFLPEHYSDDTRAYASAYARWLAGGKQGKAPDPQKFGVNQPQAQSARATAEHQSQGQANTGPEAPTPQAETTPARAKTSSRKRQQAVVQSEDIDPPTAPTANDDSRLATLLAEIETWLARERELMRLARERNLIHD